VKAKIGIQLVQNRQSTLDPYVQKTMQLDGGKFIILCMLKAQSALLMRSREIQADMTFIPDPM
jgi:hypothetical protein